MIEIMKIAAKEVIANDKPSELRFGTVISIAPLKVQISTNLILPESVLIVPEELTDHGVSMNLGVQSKPVSISVVETTLVITDNNQSEDVLEDTDDRNVTVYNALSVGDKVALLREQGGKQFYILGRL